MKKQLKIGLLISVILALILSNIITLVLCLIKDNTNTGSITKIELEDVSGLGKVRLGESIEIKVRAFKDNDTILIYDNQNNYNWTSSDENIATVSENGKIYGINVGIVTITAINKKNNSINKSIQIKVLNNINDESNLIQSISLNVKEKTLSIGEVFTLSVVVSPSNLEDITIEWDVSNKNIVSLQQNINNEYLAQITATQIGKAYIYVSTSNGLNDYVIITVKSNNEINEPTQDDMFIVDGGTITGLSDEGKNLKEITIPEKINGISVLQIGNNCFKANNKLEKVIIPNGIRLIGDEAFRDCENLREVDFSECKTLTLIGWHSFSGCKNLVKLDLRNCISLETIKSYAFQDCVRIISFVIPKNVNTIENYAFNYCFGLVELYNLSSLNIKINTISQSYGGIGSYPCVLKTDINEPSSIIILNDIIYYRENENSLIAAGLNDRTKKAILLDAKTTKIKPTAFASCYNLEDVNLSKCIKLSEIGVGAFSFCVNLKNFIIPNTVTNIGIEAFCGCKFTSIVIPSSVEVIGTDAFDISDIIIYAEATSKPSKWSDMGVVFWYSESEPTTAGNYWHYKNGQIEIW